MWAISLVGHFESWRVLRLHLAPNDIAALEFIDAVRSDHVVQFAGGECCSYLYAAE
jgi:hypothetical protein